MKDKKTMKKIFVLVVLMAMTTLQASAQNSSSAIKDVIEKAEAGSPQHQAQLAHFYFMGIGVSKDYDEAFKWYQKAAEQGSLKGLNGLGRCYFEGLGCEQDIPKALECLNKVIQAGQIEVFRGLGNYYWEGKFVAKDDKKAFDYFKRGAEKGEKECQYMLARMYLLGEGTDKNLGQAIIWYEKAANAGVAMAMSQLGTIYREIKEVRNYDKATYWNRKAVDAKHPRGMFNLGKQYLYGEGVTKNTTTGKEYIERAANMKDLNAINYLGYMAMKGIGMAKDRDKARMWFNKALAIDPTNHDAEVFLFALDQNLDKDDTGKQLLPTMEIPKQESDIYAVIIGNEDYKNEAPVPFAENDAKAFKDYLVNSLGVDEEIQIKYVVNAGLNDMLIALDWLENAMKANDGQARAIFYYAGHGIPNEKDGSAYLLPIDGIGSMPRSAFSLKELYESMSQLEAKSVVVFLDACFSGSKREKGMLSSARGVAIKAKPEIPLGKMVVFTAAQGDETAYPFTEQQHGMFTYYLLKKLKESDGKVNFGELSDYLKDEVNRQSFQRNNKTQTPTTKPSPALENSWRSMTLK